jgi:hypothetical protein
MEKYNWKGLVREIFNEIEAVREEKKSQKVYLRVQKRPAAQKGMQR